MPSPNGARRATPYETIRHQPNSRSRHSRPRTAPVRWACRINHHSPRDKSEPGPEGRTPEAGGRSLFARMKQQWASFSGLFERYAGGSASPFWAGRIDSFGWGSCHRQPREFLFPTFGRLSRLSLCRWGSPFNQGWALLLCEATAKAD